MKKYDVIVIGAGPAGGACASTCAGQGLKVAMIEDYGFGGTCPLRGCNPKKILTGAAEIIALARGLKGKGIENAPQINWKDLAEFRDSFVQGKKEQIQESYGKMGIDTYNGQAAFVDKYQVRVGSHVLEGEYFVLATGIKPLSLNVPGEEHISSSDDFLALNKLPERICFIGGGFISFEFASVAARAGARTSIVHRSSRVLKQFDADLSQGLVDALKDAGVKIHLNTPLKSVTRDDQGLLVKAGQNNNEITVQADMVVHGAGRKPDIEALNLDKPGISVSRRGIPVNQYMQCKDNPKFFAAGDAADTPFALTPTGDMEGKTAGANIIQPQSRTCDYAGIPRVVFTAPPLSAVGLLEEEAREAGIDFRVIHENMADWFSWANLGQKHAGCKILIDNDKDIIIGAHILGAGTDEMANLFALAIRMKLAVRDLKQTLWAYPTKGYYLKFMTG
ncbi:MAG: NAD(P)/FAD-dependent oxidoreductase [Desulfonatronovibrio sp.]